MDKDSDNISEYSLHLAVLYRDEELVRRLLDSGCKVDVEDNQGQTPLHVAVRNKFDKGVEMLLAKQSNVNAQDEDGNTPLHLVYQGKYWESEVNTVKSMAGWNCCNSLCKLLISHGADLGLQNSMGQTILHLVVLRNMTSIVQYVLEKGIDVNILDKNHQTPLLIAVKNENYSTSRMLLMKGAHVNISDNDSNTILHHAVKSANEKMVVMLLKFGANIGSRDASGQTGLHTAAKTVKCHFTLVLQLLMAGSVDVDSQDTDGNTALHLAVERHVAENEGDYDGEYILKLFLDWGANLQIPNNSGLTPLDRAPLHRRDLIISHMTKMKAARLFDNIDYELLNEDQNNYKEACLEELDTMKLVKIGQNSVYDFLCESGDLLFLSNFKLNHANIPIKDAFTEYHTFLVAKFIKSRQRKLLIDRALKCLNMPLPNHILEMILHNVSNADLYNIVKTSTDDRQIDLSTVIDAEWVRSNLYTIYNPANPAPIPAALRKHSLCELKHYISQTPSCLLSLDRDGRNILHIAVSRNYEEGVVALLEAGIDINIRTVEGDTPLHIASSTGHESLVELLVAKGADLDITNEAGMTPLHVAVLKKNAYIVQLLLENGCSVSLKNMFNYYSNFDLSLEIAYLLTVYGAYFNEIDTNTEKSIFRQIVKGSSPLVCEWILENGADPNCEGGNPLHVVCERWHNAEEVCRLLLDHGADVKARDSSGRTPLHMSVDDKKIKLLKMLVEAGGDLEARDTQGRTALHYAAETNLEAVCVTYLLENGADACTRDNKGNTPLDLGLMSWSDSTSIIEALMDWGGSKMFLKYSKDGMAFTHRVHPNKWKCLIECIIKHRCANILRAFADTTPISETFNSFEQSCLTELKKMKTTAIGRTSCFAIISNYSDPRYVQNSEMEQNLNSDKLKTQFPIYSSLLYVTFMKAKKRFLLLDIAQEHFKIGLPSEIVRHILVFLDDDDLGYLVSQLQCNDLECS